MTRFATFWVENGEIVAPVPVMRFDDTFPRMFGEGLIALGEDQAEPDCGVREESLGLHRAGVPGVHQVGERLEQLVGDHLAQVRRVKASVELLDIGNIVFVLHAQHFAGQRLVPDDNVLVARFDGLDFPFRESDFRHAVPFLGTISL